MNRLLIATAMSLSVLTAACSDDTNILTAKKFGTPHEVPPFDQIRYRDYIPAFEYAINEVDQTISLITGNREKATFENTIKPFDRRQERLTLLRDIFDNLRETENCDTMTVIAENLLPMLSSAEDKTYMNKALFERIKTVYDNREKEGLDSAQIRVVEACYNKFIRKGALLSDNDQKTLSEYNKQIALLELDFGNNMLAETNGYKLVIDTISDLSGLPESVISMAAQRAEEYGMHGKWVFTLHNASIMPFLKYSDRHDLRKQIYEAYTMRGNNGNENDNKENIIKLASTRAKRAKLLGYNTHAEYVIGENMAATPQIADSFMNDLWEAALRKAKNELADMKQFAYKYDKTTTIEACDWSYWAEKLRKNKYDIEEKELSEYFAIDNVRKGMFDVANKLYGISMKHIDDIPHYNQDNDVYEVYDKDSSYLGLIYFDYYPRSSKSGGAWCTTFKRALDEFDGKHIPAQVSIAYNFTMPTSDIPALLTYDEVKTMFHEFGHALHALFSKGQYRATCGNVPNDYVEMPSQIMENWASEPEVLKSFAHHYKTGETIPDELIAKLETASTFNQGFETVEYLAAAILDLKWHSITTEDNITDVNAFESQALEAIGLIPEIHPRYHSTYFAHIFDGGYDAGYYVYIWAELLDADAFKHFKNSGNIYNQELAASFRENCLANAGTYESMEQYIKFRGQKPTIEPLIERRGLNEQPKRRIAVAAPKVVTENIKPVGNNE